MADAKGAPAKPASVSSDPYRSGKWDEIVRGRDFGPEDVPSLTLLVQWYQVVDKCIDDISVEGGGIRVAQEDGRGEQKAMPQLSIMQKASAEIRQLNKQLGIRVGREAGEAGDGGDDGRPPSRLQLVRDSVDARRRRTA